MKRRALFKSLLASAITPFAIKQSSAKEVVLLQQAPLAGFQYYQGPELWPVMRTGQPLALKREPDNPHDARAIAIYWQDQKIGYFPRRDNAAAAQLLDNGHRLKATISELQQSQDPWQRVQFNVWLG